VRSGNRSARYPKITCPRCWDTITWNRDDPRVFIHPDDGPSVQEVDLTDREEAKRRDYLKIGYRPCPNQTDDMPAHYIPATYGEYRDPLAIGLVGASESGKSHLLAAMIRQAHAGGLEPYGLEVSQLDVRRHSRYRSMTIERLEDGKALDGTSRGVAEYIDMLVVRRIRDGATRVLTFFDVAGEDLRATDNRGRVTTRFLIGRPALIFTYAAGEGVDVRRDHQEIALALDRLKMDPTCRQLPAAIAMTMADRLRFVPPVDRWITRPAGPVDAAARNQESRDLYAHLYANGAEGALAPFAFFDRCTVHAVSATGGDARVTSSGEKAFVRGYRPMRVLEPLVSVLSIAGVIGGREAERVGR
jgi:hypothetical protein